MNAASRAHLVPRVEPRLERGCFWSSAWQDTFYRDLRIVRQAFEASRYRLLYSRNKQQHGYYLDGQPALSSEIKQVLKSSAAEVDQRQIDIYRKLSCAERFYQGCSISDIARKVVCRCHGAIWPVNVRQDCVLRLTYVIYSTRRVSA